MPSVRRLTPEEVQTIERKGSSQRQQRDALYDELVRQFATGDYAEVELEAGDTKPTVRSNINKAAMRAGMDLTWLRGQSGTLKFKVTHSPFDSVEPEAVEPDDSGGDVDDEEFQSFELAPDAPQPEPEPTPPAPAPKRPARKQRVTDTQPFVEAP